MVTYGSPASKYHRERREVSRIQGDSIKAGRRHCWTSRAIQIPPLPPSKLEGCKYIDISYKLVVCIKDSEVQWSLTLGMFHFYSFFIDVFCFQTCVLNPMIFIWHPYSKNQTLELLMRSTVGEVFLCICDMLRNSVMVNLSITRRYCLSLIAGSWLLMTQNAHQL